jgi:hypothetical protein
MLINTYNRTTRRMPSSKSKTRNLYAVHHADTGLPVHIQTGVFSDKSVHLMMVNNNSILGYELIDPTCVGRDMSVWWTNGNLLYENKFSSRVSGLRECGVQMYYHPTHGQVYLVYNLHHQKPIPLLPQPPQPHTERLLHPFQ